MQAPDPRAPDGPEGSDPTAAIDALPVRLLLDGAHAESVRRWVESVVGWQPVTDDSARLVPPALALTVVGRTGEISDDEPAVLLVTDRDRPEEAARAARDVAAIVAWPEERDALGDVARRLLRARPRRVGEELRVAGGAGGVGTTTIALALGGIAAWRRRATLVVSGRRARPDPGGELDGAAAWRSAAPVAGVDRLRHLKVDDPSARLRDVPAELVVRDLGVTTDTDVLVIRRDRAGLAAVAATSAGVVVVADVGPAEPRAVTRAAGGRRLVVAPWSARVARADLAGRVPVGVPGTWLRRIAVTFPEGRT